MFNLKRFCLLIFLLLLLLPLGTSARMDSVQAQECNPPPASSGKDFSDCGEDSAIWQIPSEPSGSVPKEDLIDETLSGQLPEITIMDNAEPEKEPFSLPVKSSSPPEE